ncbi:MAG: hypothetical protein ACAI38_25330 [Myxococcota bacterium]|nr:hypothetical protein [Myxococcota bacterium]
MSFVRGIEARAEDVSRRGKLNAATVTLDSGAVVAQRATAIRPHEHRHIELMDRYGAVTNDADVSGVPLRAAHDAWLACRAALVAVGVEAAGVVSYAGEYGDCRKLAVTVDQRLVGPFSILDGTQPRDRGAIEADLRRLLAH